MGDNSKEDVVELVGHSINRVKHGLDEAQVASLVDELVSERDKLAKSQEHIGSLHRLAEKTVREADELAQQIKTEAGEQATAEGNNIIEKAKEQAKDEANDIIEKANKEGQKIVEEKQAEAERKAALLLENGKKRVQDELGSLADQQFDHLLKELEGLGQQITAAKADFRQKLSRYIEESGNMTVESEAEGDAATVRGGNGLDETPTQTETMDQDDKARELSKLFETEDQAEAGEPQWEIEILPPVDTDKIMAVVNFLDQLPGIANTEIIPRNGAPSIAVFLREPVDLASVLHAVPEVAYVEENATDENANGSTPQTVRIGFTADAVPQK